MALVNVKLKFFGFLVSIPVRFDPGKVEIVRSLPSLKIICDVRGFLGLTQHLRNPIQDYASIVPPLTDLLKQGNFDWDMKAQLCLAMTKSKISCVTIIQFLNIYEHLSLKYIWFIQDQLKAGQARWIEFL